MASTGIESDEMSDDFYRAFEERHRGSHDLIKNRLKVYLPFVLPLYKLYPESKMIDLGCGRGEWLDLLRDNFVDVIGIDIEDGMLNACKDLGLNTQKIEALDYLSGLPENSVSVISAFHLVEHVTFEHLRSLVGESMRVLKPGGLLIMETPNPENIMVGTESFYIDPSHIKPIPPALLSFLPEYYGFIRTKVLRLQESEFLKSNTSLTLSDVLHGVSPDFSVVAQKEGAEEMLNVLDDVFRHEYGLNLRTMSENYDVQMQNKIDYSQNLVMQQTNERASQAELREAEVRASLQETLVVVQQTNERASQAELRESEVRASLQETLVVVQQTNERASQAELREVEVRASLQETLVVVQQTNERASKAELREVEVRASLQETLVVVQQTNERASKAELREAEVRASLQETLVVMQQTNERASKAELREAEVRASLQETLVVMQQTNERASQAELREAEVRASLQETLVVMQQTNERASQAESKSQEIAAELNLVYMSWSWKLTYVLRWLNLNAKKLLRFLRGFFLNFKTLKKSPPDIEDKKDLPKLLFVSPLPPEQTGIADYSAQLIPELSKYYSIDYVLVQKKVNKINYINPKRIRSVEWFKFNAPKYKHIVYHIGNSSFHSYMIDLMNEFPGVLVVHDFFLGHFLANEEISERRPYLFSRALYFSHGYHALQVRFEKDGLVKAVEKFPANYSFLKNAKYLVFHSEYSKKLLSAFYPEAKFNSAVIPFLKSIPNEIKKTDARKKIGLSNEDYVVCSFGQLGSTKLNHRLIESWIESDLALDKRCVLIFVGDAPQSDYINELNKSIRNIKLSTRILITGWVNASLYHNYLAAADCAVQLRCSSRGETSAAVMDCMSYGLPTIVNANGSMAELPEDVVFLLDDYFHNNELVHSLNLLKNDIDVAQSLSKSCKHFMLNNANPEFCGLEYANLINSAQDFRPTSSIRPQKILFIDVTAIVKIDLKTGIQRVVRAVLREFLNSVPSGCRVEPVFLSDTGGLWSYWHARSFTIDFLSLPKDILEETPAQFISGDILLVLDFDSNSVIEASRAGLYDELRSKSVSVNIMVYDLIPIKRPEFFPDGTSKAHAAWLSAISAIGNHLICISESVAQDLKEWLAKNLKNNQTNAIRVSSVHLGADIESSMPSMGISPHDLKFVKKIKSSYTFLMAGTIEPRKGHLQTIAAFEILWKKGIDVNLLIVGKEGWLSIPKSSRRTIPKIVDTINNSPELNKKLFWLNDANDEFLLSIYKASTCLIAASEDEGFGLPLIEAARNNLPIIARDISVFREVAGDSAYYFDGLEPDQLAKTIEKWLKLYSNNVHPSPIGIEFISWKDCIYEIYRSLNFNNEL